MNAPLDNNTSMVFKGDVLCTANLGWSHPKPRGGRPYRGLHEGLPRAK
jgi:hypothetical protein